MTEDRPSRGRDTYRTGKEDDRLVQLHIRVRSSTLDSVETISEKMNWTKASSARYLLEVGLDHSNFESRGSSRIRCIDCSQDMVKVNDSSYGCQNCGAKVEVKN
jgi:DNA-directed RNA polymerase subunit RPC12/RpoP